MEPVPYRVGNVRWLCLRFDRVQAHLDGIRVEDLPALHARLRGLARQWDVACRFFGLIPKVIPVSNPPPPEQRRVWDTEELADSLGLARGGLAQELSAVAGVWLNTAKVRAVEDGLERKAKAAKEEAFTGELSFTQDEVLRKFGFPESMFTGAGDDETKRPAADVSAEKDWFCRRVNELRKPLEDPMAGELVRALLDTELRRRRYQERVRQVTANPVNIGGEAASRLEKLLQDLDKVYLAQLDRLDSIASWMSELRGKIGFHGVVADLVRAIQMAHRQRDASLADSIEKRTGVELIFDDERLVDGVFTGAELQIALRTSVHAPRPQYRPDIVATIVAAKAGLFDPEWRPPFRAQQLKRLQAGWHGAEEACRKELGVHVPDLLEDGLAGEHEDIVRSAEA